VLRSFEPFHEELHTSNGMIVATVKGSVILRTLSGTNCSVILCALPAGCFQM
jgi:hypothetical protein